MAGHSKFANIKHRKAAQDGKRTKLFTKLARQITVAAKLNGPDPLSNASLKMAITKAKYNNLPKDRIERAIKAATSPSDQGSNYEEVRYEGYGSDGIAIMAEALTDNKNRTASEIRTIFNKAGGNLGASGSVSHMFKQYCMLSYQVSYEDIFLQATEAGVLDIISDDENHSVLICNIKDATNIRMFLLKNLGEPTNSEIQWIPDNPILLTQEKAGRITELIEMLEDNDDIQNVYTNMSTE